MLPSTLVESLVKNTNDRIVETMSTLKPEVLMDTKNSHINITDKLELTAFIGLLYLRGMKGAALDDLNHLYSISDGIPAMSAVMSKNRFCFLLRHLTFETAQQRKDRAEHWKRDRLV